MPQRHSHCCPSPHASAHAATEGSHFCTHKHKTHGGVYPIEHCGHSVAFSCVLVVVLPCFYPPYEPCISLASPALFPVSSLTNLFLSFSPVSSVHSSHALEHVSYLVPLSFSVCVYVQLSRKCLWSCPLTLPAPVIYFELRFSH